jgi:exopolysaccharide production protein ExoZ
MNSTRITGIDLLRAWAVTLTVALHLIWLTGLHIYSIDVDRIAMKDADSAFLAFFVWIHHSQHGVYIFFVLSGFLIARIWFGQERPSYLVFLKQRAARLLPLLWLVLVVAHFSPMLYASPADATLGALLRNLLLLNWILPGIQTHYLLPTWSLAWEWIFYIAFPLIWLAACWIARSGRIRGSITRGFLALLVVICVLTVLWAAHEWRPRGGTYLLLFAVGVAVAWWDVNARDILRSAAARLSWVLVIVAGFVVAFAYAWFSPANGAIQFERYGKYTPHDLFVLAYLLPIGALFVKVAFTDWNVRNQCVRIASWIGRISYSLYLWHMVVMLALVQWLPTLPFFAAAVPSVRVALFAFLSVVTTFALSEMTYRLIEQPYFNRRRALSPVKSSEIKIS